MAKQFASLRTTRILKARDNVDPDDVIIPPAIAKTRGMTSTIVLPTGNICPEGSVIKATSIDPEVVGADGVFLTYWTSQGLHERTCGHLGH